MINSYITTAALVVLLLSLVSAAALFSNPETFKVKWWVKALGLFNFLVDGTGGLIIAGHTAFNWPLLMLYVGVALILTSGAGILAVFLYVHTVVIPKHRRDGL